MVFILNTPIRAFLHWFTRSVSVLLLIGLVMSTHVLRGQQFAGGNGTPGTPYLINNLTHFDNIRHVSNSAHFKLINHIDATSTANLNNGQGFLPFGWFGGVLEGDGYTVTGLVINRPGSSSTGLFSSMGSDAVVKNIHFESIQFVGGNRIGFVTGTLGGTITNITVSGSVSGIGSTGGLVGQIDGGGIISESSVNMTVSGSSGTTGGIVGLLNSNAQITNVVFNGSVNGTTNVGGFAGQMNSDSEINGGVFNGTVTATGNLIGGIAGFVNSGTIINCTATGSVTGNNEVGGLAGRHAFGNGVITGSNASVAVLGNQNVGGIAGYHQDGLIELSYSSGTVSGYENVGGISGQSRWGSALIRFCFSEANVIGLGSDSNQIGGLVGDLNQGSVQNCYALGSVSGNNRVGGLVGQVDGSGSVLNSFSAGQVTGSAGQAGGLIGRRAPAGTITSSFWDTQTSGMNSSQGGLGRTTAQMTNQSIYTNAGWNFSTIWGIDPDINNGYPFLLALSGAFQLVWTGQIDSVWEKSGNWSLYRIPDLNDNIIIPNVTNKPILSSQTTVKALTIQPNASLSIDHNGALTVVQSLINNAGNSGLTILSNPSGTGSIIHQPGNVSATFQRYIPGEPEAWHTLSSPMTAQNISPEFTPPGTYGDGTGYDLYHWHEPDTSWIYYNHPGAWNNTHGMMHLIPGRGYLVAYQDTNPTFSFRGILNTGNVTINLTRSAGLSDEFGYNLTGNPFPSSIDWKASGGWVRTALEQSAGGYNIYIWNDTALNYGVYNSASAGNQGTLGTGRYIAPTQGFFVKAAQSGSLSFSDDIRVHNGSGNWFKGSKGNDKQITLSVSSQNNTGSDQVMIEFGHEENEGGAEKKFSFMPAAPSLYLPHSGTNWSVRMLNHTENHPAIAVAFNAPATGTYVFHANFDKSVFTTLFLEDLKTGHSHNLLLTPLYVFSTEKNDDPNRFVIRFTEGGWPNPHLPLPAHLYTASRILFADLRLLDPDTEYTLHLLDLSARTVFSHTLTGGTTHNIPLLNLSGLFIAKLEGSEGVYSTKLFW
jgi:hypothetical protein